MPRAQGKNYSLFSTAKVTVIPVSKKAAAPTQNAAAAQGSQRSCKHQTSYVGMQAISLNRNGADRPVLVYTEGILIICDVKQWIIGLKEGSELPTASLVMIKSIYSDFILVNSWLHKTAQFCPRNQGRIRQQDQPICTIGLSHFCQPEQRNISPI